MEWLCIVALGALAVKLLNISWRKWCDPQIDYGRELYIPWRMAEGAKWLKDIDDLYGPLSRFIDAGLFKVFGPGIMVLAWANIIIYFGILTLVYILFKRAWGVVAAIAVSFIFVGVFSFSQLTITSNYNFVTPYSQQVTHGFLVCLLLVWLLPSWIKASTPKRSFGVGLMVGLTAVLKPEFVLASGILIIISLFFHIKLRGLPSVRCLLAGFVGCVLPTLLFFGIFSTYLPIRQAGFAACYAWLNGVFIWNDELTAHLLNSFSGMDQPKIHFIAHALATGWALAIITSIVAAGLITRFIKLKGAQVGLGVLLALSVAAIGLKSVIWISLGQSLVGLLLIYIVHRAFKELSVKDQESDDRAIEKTLLCALALALMTRMILNGRIYQYGFIQASLASLVISAVLIEELPRLMKFEGLNFAIYRLCIGILLLCGVLSILAQSKTMEVAKTLPIGSGHDLFYAYPKTVSFDGELVKNVTETLLKNSSPQTLVVVPEGIMINYLTRKVSPVSAQAFYTNRKLEQELVKTLDKNKPDKFVLISRDLTEYGVTQFGAKGQSGELIVDWILHHYKVSASHGQDPLKLASAGATVYKLSQ